MAFKTDVSQLKLAEKLVILNDRAVGMLTRIYNIKKACSDAKSRPAFLNDKSLDAAIAHIAKKFPVVDLKRNSSAFISVNEMRVEIIKKLSLYYYTFADLLELKDHILRMLTTMDANQCQLDITLNYDLTAGYLNLVVNYMCMMMLLARVDDRKIVLGLFNAAYDFANNCSEASFPRLGQMIADYENPLKKLCEDLGPLNRLIQAALSSLRNIYFRRNISAEHLREASMLSLVSNPKEMLYAAQTNTIACEYLSLDVMDRWIIFGVTVCHGQLLADATLASMFNRALHHGMALRLFRDESILIFSMLTTLFESIKGYNKKIQELKELSVVALQTCGSLHAHRRQFLRSALRELCLLIRDQPGLLGPKILFVWMGLSFARDEILWLLRHVDIWPLVNVHKKTKQMLKDVLNDKYLPELIHYVVELRLLVLKHTDIISRYYTDYVAGYDALLLREIVADLKGLSSHDEILVQSFIESISSIRDNGASGTTVDLRGIRLDWFRFQASTSVGRSTFRLEDNVRFTVEMNTAIFHLKMIDNVDEMLRETSDLSIYGFYSEQFDAQLNQCLNFPAQSRYALAFSMIASTFANALHEMCPEERQHIIQKALITCNVVLEEVTRRTTEVFAQMADNELQLEVGTSPHNCAKIMAIVYQQQQVGKNQPTSAPDVKMPGRESVREAGTASNVTTSDKNYLYLVELCQAIATYKQIHMHDYTFVPREFLAINLERQLQTALMQHLRTADNGSPNSVEMTAGGGGHPRRPSEMLTFLNAQLAVLQSVDASLSFNVARLFNDTLLQQSQAQDSQGAETMTAVYARWYLEVLLRRASVGHLIYSAHFQAFMSNSEANGGVGFAAERYTDVRELRALAQLIGTYGVKFMAERLTWHISCQIIELYKIIREYRETLHTARINFDKPEKLREVVALLNLPAAELSGAGSSKERRLTAATIAAAASSAASSSTTTSASTPTSGSGSVSSSSNGATAAATAAVAAASAAAPTGASGASTTSPLESLLQRVTIIGEIIAFRDLMFRALHDVLEQKMPFLLSSMHDLIDSINEEQKIAIGEMCAAAGVKADVDLALVNAMQTQAQTHKLHDSEEHYNLSCLLFVFIAIALPKLAVSRQSAFKATFIASQNNCHTIPLAVNTMAGALFFFHHRNDVHERMREFLALASSGLLQIVGTTDAEQMQNYRSVYILLERLVDESPWLNFGLLESCFPYTLLRCAYLNCYRQEEAQQQQQLQLAAQMGTASIGTALFAMSTTISGGIASNLQS